MHFLHIFWALATASTTIALPAAANNQPAIPNLPEGFFAGYNNPDGTSTLQFTDLNRNFTFTPTAAPEASANDLEKRADGWSDCWAGRLDTRGVDNAINEMRTRLSHTPIGLGQYSNWPPYFGYNSNGAYVYFCVNNQNPLFRYSFTMADLNWFVPLQDKHCGPYVPGYTLRQQYDWVLYGKAFSGTKVCQGNSRSPR